MAVDAAGRVTRFVEKPPRNEIFSDLTNAGVLVMDPPILRYVPAEGFSDISRDLLPALLQAGVPVFAQDVGRQRVSDRYGHAGEVRPAQREWPTPAAAEHRGDEERNDD